MSTPRLALPVHSWCPSRHVTVRPCAQGTALAFFILELKSSREILVEQSTGHPPSLALDKTKRWHVFLSHSWDNQDQVATIKRQLQLLLPGVRCFLE